MSNNKESKRVHMSSNNESKEKHKNKIELKKNVNRIISMIQTEKEVHEQIIAMFQKELAQLPDGGLSRKVINGKPYLYHSYPTEIDQKYMIKQRCIKNCESHLILSLKRKHFVKKSMPILLNNVQAIDTFLKKYIPYDASHIADIMTNSYGELPNEVVEAVSCNVKSRMWLEEDYQRNDLYKDHLIHTTIGGLKVRSKSEAIIAGLLEVNNVPFRYESSLILNDKIYYPDFTILRPKDGGIIYWEHFGMIENDLYNYSMEQKIKVYKDHGITPWNNLITTYDSENGSIDAQTILNIIKAFIL